MKRTRSKNTYALLWFVEIVIANVSTFMTANGVYDSNFYITLIFTNVGYLTQLVCTFYLFTRKTEEQFFLNMPIPVLSNVYLAIMSVLNNAFLLFDIPVQLTLLVCLTGLGLCAGWISHVKLAASIVLETSEEIKAKTLFMKEMTADTEACIKMAKSEEAEKICSKLYEEVRYSDPMSNEALEVYESEMAVNFRKFKNAVSADNIEEINKYSYEFLNLLELRNKKCRILKDA